MPIPFEATTSYCYRVSRRELLDEIAAEPGPRSGEIFRMRDISPVVIMKHLTPEQLDIEVKAAKSERVYTIEHLLKYFISVLAKKAPESPFICFGKGMYQLKSDADIQQEMEETEDEAEDEDDDETIELKGWIYAFSFPVLVKPGIAFPIKIGKTSGDVKSRVAFQCKGSASFENPVILGSWQVNRVGAVESAIHDILKSRGKWRDSVPGTEWFDTTLAEIEAIINFIIQPMP